MIALDVCLDPVEAPDFASENPTPPPVKKRGGGPKTPEGKAIASRNALKDGLSSTVLLPRDMEADARLRRQQFADHFRVAGPYGEWVIGRLAFVSVQIDRCQRMTFENLGQTSQRAATYWEKDQQKRVVELARRLRRDPMRTVAELEQTRQGADWLIAQWQGLGSALDVSETWDDTQRTLAFDLLGTHPALRAGFRSVPAPSDRDGLIALVEREIDRLEEAKTSALDMLDEHEQILAVKGLPLHEDARTARLRKYDVRLANEWKRTHDEVTKLKARDPGALARQAEFERSHPTAPTAEATYEQAREQQKPLFEQLAAVIEAFDEEARELEPVESAPIARSTEPRVQQEREEESKPSVEITPTERQPAEPASPKGNRRHRRARSREVRREARQQVQKSGQGKPKTR